MTEGSELIGKRIGVAIDFSECSRKALRWVIKNLDLRKGDHLILVAVLHGSSYESGEQQLWKTTGSPLIPYNDFSNKATMKKYKIEPDAETLKICENASKERQIIPLMKIFWGDPREKICDAINAIPLHNLVIGNRGLGPLKRAILGSVSNHVVNHASCPITVVH